MARKNVTKFEEHINYEEHIKTICSLTNYPRVIVEDILSTSRLVLIEQIADKVIDNEEFPDEVVIDLPKLGKLVIERLVSGRTGDIGYTFLPSKNFHNDVLKSYYYGDTPLIDLAKVNIEKVMKFRLDNIVREGDD